MSSPDPATLIERLARERARGRLWRARELAQQYPEQFYDRDLWRACGDALLESHDPERAGKLLFLAGSEDPAHRDAIELYLARDDKHRIGHHLRRLPGFEVPPEHTRRALAARGIESIPARRTGSAEHGGIGELWMWALLIGVLALIAIGAKTVFGWMTG